MSGASVSPSQHASGRAPLSKLVLINPPALRGRTNERTFSGGIGVSRKLKPLEREQPEILAIDFLYAAAVAERAGVGVELVDLLLDRLQGRAAERFCASKIGPATERTWVGVRLSMPSLLQDLAFANRIKAVAPRARVFVFGAVVLATLDHWSRQCLVDYVLFGEPEAIVDRLVTADDPLAVEGVLDPKAYRPLEGEARWDEAQVTARQRRWVRVAELAKLPRPAWHLLEMHRYAPPGQPDREVSLYVQASRGCPIACTMCPYALLEGRSWRKNDIERVVDEIVYLRERYGIYRMRFRDPNFGFKREYARQLAEALIARGIRVAATIETSLEVLDEDTLIKLARAGITTITTGVETDDEACLESLGQSIQVNAKLRERIAFCHRLGMHVYGTFCLGAPEETWDTVERTWRFANQLDIESGFTVMTPFPGTKMYWRALAEQLIPRKMSFEKWNSYASTMRTYALTTTDLDMARWWARMETIIPYRKKRLPPNAPKAWLEFYGKHLPHYALRQVCRAYVAYRRRVPGPVVAPPTVRSEGDAPPSSVARPRNG